MRITFEEREALKKSIRHWEKDILYYFKLGNEVIQLGYTSDLYWRYFINNNNVIYPKFYNNDGSSKVECYSSSCDLCKLNAEVPLNEGCNKCIYTKFYGRPCYSLGQAWNLFNNNPIRHNAEYMIYKLKKIDSGIINYIKEKIKDAFFKIIEKLYE